MKNIFEELSKKEFEISYSNTKESAEKIKKFLDFYSNYKNSIRKNAGKIERNLEKLVELEKETEILFVERIKNNIDEKIFTFYKRLENDFKYDYGLLKDYALSGNFEKAAEKRKETDFIAENYKIISEFAPKINEIEKYSKNIPARKNLAKQCCDLEKLFNETKWNKSNIQHLENIYRKNFWFIFPNNLLRKMKRKGFFEGQILAEKLKKEIKEAIIFVQTNEEKHLTENEKKYFAPEKETEQKNENNFVHEIKKDFLHCRKDFIPGKYFGLDDVLSCRTAETNWNDRFEKALKIFSLPESDDEKNYLRSLYFSLRKNLENGYLSRLYNFNAQNPATIFLKTINYNI